ncbi:MAG: hypothetical protein WBE26_04800 [Phycisphaerae bacterium]
MFSLPDRDSLIRQALAPNGTNELLLRARHGRHPTPPEGIHGIAQHPSTPRDTRKEESAKRRAKVEAGGIEPRTLDLQVLLGQALTRVGKEGLVSCLALLCSDEDLAFVVEAWRKLSASRKRLILDAVEEGGADEGCQEVPRGASVPRGLAEQINVCMGPPDRPSGGVNVNRIGVGRTG